MGCFGGFGPCFCALTAAMGGKGKDGGADFLAAGGAANGGTKGWTGGACLGACAMGASGPLPTGGIMGGAADGIIG